VSGVLSAAWEDREQTALDYAVQADRSVFAACIYLDPKKWAWRGAIERVMRAATP
jgi:hypothetical protein